MAGDDPVAMTKRRACTMTLLSTVTVAGSVKRAAPAMTCTPRLAKRSTESFGATAAITLRTWWYVREKSTFGCASIPNAPDVAQALARLAAAINAFEGTQP